MLFYRVALTGGRGTSGYPSEEFFSLFDQAKDLRYRLFALKALGYSTTVGDMKYDDGVVLQYYRNAKVKMTQGFSYPELLLMRAETYTRTSLRTEALADLNTLRKYRYDNIQGSTDLPNGAALTEDQLLEEILKERRRELPIATFQRVLDLKRLALDNGKPWCKTTIEHKIGAQTYSAPINSEYYVLPIPNNIIKYNPQWGLPLDTRLYSSK